MTTPKLFSLTLIAAALSASLSAQADRLSIDAVQGAQDNNAANNPAIQPDPDFDPSPGDIPDQTMQFGEVMRGERADEDFVQGGLGTDILLPGRGNDVLMGGTEHFNPLNRDRAFGDRGDDVFVWQPGDGSDRFEGGRGDDAVMFALVAEDDDGDRLLFDLVDFPPSLGGGAVLAEDVEAGVFSNFRVRRDQQAGTVLMREDELLPLVDVAAGPGFCEVLDRNSIIPGVEDTAAAFEELDVDHLIRFRLRANQQLAVTIQTKDVETVVCGGQIAGDVEVFDLTVSPPNRIITGTTDFIDLPRSVIGRNLQDRINQLLVDSQAEIAAGNNEIGIATTDR